MWASAAGLQTLLDSLNVPYPTTSVHINRRIGELPHLVDMHNESVEKLEEVLTTYLKKGSPATKRPKMRIGGFAGMGGQRVDTIDYLTKRIKALETRVEGVRESIGDGKAEK